jgi:hypothetical protein
LVATAQRDDNATTGAKSSDVSVDSVGTEVPIDAVTRFASMYGKADKSIGIADASSTKKRNLSGYQLAVRDALSKRTYLYALKGTNKGDGSKTNTVYKQQDTAIGIAPNF